MPERATLDGGSRGLLDARAAAALVEPALERACGCESLDRDELRLLLERDLGGSEAVAEMLEDRPHLFATLPAFVDRSDLDAMKSVVAAVEGVVASDAYRKAALSAAPDIAQEGAETPGVLDSYDFHLGPDGPKLIEINSNAGGALLGLYAARAQHPDCPPAIRTGIRTALRTGAAGRPRPEIDALERRLVETFRREWQLAAPSGKQGRSLRTVAIVDEDPTSQFLHPEMLLFVELFRRYGIEARVCDPRELQLREGALRIGDLEIDLVYNRLTDFYLECPEHAALATAWREGLAVVTPHPRGHALRASKRNLVVLSDAERLRDLGVDERTIEELDAAVPSTVLVTPENADDLWARRRQLFFKPVAGFGSRGAFRGAKLTRRVWGEILAGSFVAQERVVPSERASEDEADPRPYKLDVRAYAYDGEILFFGARVYRGQTTNLRTPGGGLAPVLTSPPREPSLTDRSRKPPCP